jgi:hypothetical protein
MVAMRGRHREVLLKRAADCGMTAAGTARPAHGCGGVPHGGGEAMTRGKVLAVAAMLSCVAGGLAAELVGVHGSSTQFTTTMDWTVNGKPVKMVLTGTALRQKVFVNVYSVASYIEEGSGAKTADDLVAAECPKQMHLVMERTVAGADIAEAFRSSVRQNHPAPAFADEIGLLVDKLHGWTAVRGDHIYLTHFPGVGLQIKVAGREEFVIRNPAFTRAIWDIYFGKNNIGEGIKRGLTSRL